MSIKAYKGFNKDMTCRGFQFKEGETYEEERAVVCKTGFHACENPLDCLSYYGPNESIYREVELDGDVSREEGRDSKIAASKIKIGAKIDFKGMIKASVDFVLERVKATTGDYAHSATTGDYAHSATTGDSAHSATTGYSAHSATTGYYAHSATTGNSAHSATTGNSAHSATTGDYAHSATTGNSAHSATTGYYAHSEVKGENAIAAALGAKSKARGALGCWIVLAEWDTTETWKLVNVKAARIDGETLKPDTWYKLENGAFVEAGGE